MDQARYFFRSDEPSRLLCTHRKTAFWYSCSTIPNSLVAVVVLFESLIDWMLIWLITVSWLRYNSSCLLLSSVSDTNFVVVVNSLNFYIHLKKRILKSNGRCCCKLLTNFQVFPTHSRCEESSVKSRSCAFLFSWLTKGLNRRPTY